VTTFPTNIVVASWCFVSKSQPLFRVRQVEAAWKTIAKYSKIVVVDSRHIDEEATGLTGGRTLKKRN
jgi:hypothetical protein